MESLLHHSYWNCARIPFCKSIVNPRFVDIFDIHEHQYLKHIIGIRVREIDLPASIEVVCESGSRSCVSRRTNPLKPREKTGAMIPVGPRIRRVPRRGMARRMEREQGVRHVLAAAPCGHLQLGGEPRVEG